MKLAQIVLRAAESRKLIARAVSQMEEVQEALRKHRIILCTSSITPDILMALGYGNIPDAERGFYVCGMVRGEGLCTTNFDLVRSSAIIDKGVIIDDKKHRACILDSIGAGDVYIKSPNILDSNERVGVLAGAPSCGMVGKMVYGLNDSEYTIIAPTLLLKSAPVDLRTLPETVAHHTYERDASEIVKYSCGMPVNLVILPERTKVITEITAIKQLFNLDSDPIAMTGVGSGADALVLSVRGPEKYLEKFWKYLCSIKGTLSIITYPTDCKRCPDAENSHRCGGYIGTTNKH